VLVRPADRWGGKLATTNAPAGWTTGPRRRTWWTDGPGQCGQLLSSTMTTASPGSTTSPRRDVAWPVGAVAGVRPLAHQANSHRSGGWSRDSDFGDAYCHGAHIAVGAGCIRKRASAGADPACTGPPTSARAGRVEALLPTTLPLVGHAVVTAPRDELHLSSATTSAVSRRRFGRKRTLTGAGSAVSKWCRAAATGAAPRYGTHATLWGWMERAHPWTRITPGLVAT
jgi:hypothetical protein